MQARLVALASLLSLLVVVAPAAADDIIPGHRIDQPTEGLIIGAALLATAGFAAVPDREGGLWSRELFGDADRRVQANFSPRAAAISDGLVGASLIAPVVYLTGSTIEDADGDRLILYGETLAIDTMLAEAAKRLVRRPRPYRYSHDPAAIAYAASEGDDAELSFYSGHAALSFGAAVAGAYLLGASSDNHAARLVAWGAGMATAAAAANLRVRAGKHYYSDVVIGGAIGITVGYLVPALHADGRPYVPDPAEVAMALGGLAGGVLLSQLIPLERGHGETARGRVAARLRFAPVPIQHGAGFGMFGTL